jgi:hypothetical protein
VSRPDQIEEWRLIVTSPSYEVSSLGRIRRRVQGRNRPAGALIAGALRRGYRVVNLTENGKCSVHPVNRLVCTAFHGAAPSSTHHAAHRDGNSLNDSADNLRWATPAENIADKDRHGTLLRGSRCSYAKLTEADVAAIRSEPKRRGLHVELAERFGVSRETIAGVRCRPKKHWPHVPFPGGATDA